jgi:hypothetical protein
MSYSLPSIRLGEHSFAWPHRIIDSGGPH